MSIRILDNLGLKLISLVLGFSLWYIVAGGQGAEIVLPIPLEYRNVPEGMEVIEESVQQVDIRLRGSSNNTLSDITASDNPDGIWFWNSHNNNNLTNINASDNSNRGIWVYYSHNNTLSPIL